ncbi:hypothetical protein [Paenibacillus sp. y28]|uniref:hypothetical protein n=1 Tax=Paenibacillus sp. y28 TaxID=3129110 RepID=UPI003015EE23
MNTINSELYTNNIKMVFNDRVELLKINSKIYAPAIVIVGVLNVTKRDAQFNVDFQQMVFLKGNSKITITSNSTYFNEYLVVSEGFIEHKGTKYFDIKTIVETIGGQLLENNNEINILLE